MSALSSTTKTVAASAFPSRDSVPLPVRTLWSISVVASFIKASLREAVKENVQTKNIPIILLSARAGEESKIEGYETGADDYLIKPFSAKELLARVASQLKLVKLRQATETNVRNLFMQAPAVIGVLRGPQHINELANAMYLQLIGNRNIIGKPIREALPELEGSGIYELLDEVYKTGEPFIANEMPVTLQFHLLPKTTRYY